MSRKGEKVVQKLAAAKGHYLGFRKQLLLYTTGALQKQWCRRENSPFFVGKKSSLLPETSAKNNKALIPIIFGRLYATIIGYHAKSLTLINFQQKENTLFKRKSNAILA